MHHIDGAARKILNICIDTRKTAWSDYAVCVLVNQYKEY